MGKRERKQAAVVTFTSARRLSIVQIWLANAASLFSFVLVLMFALTAVGNAHSQSNIPTTQKKAEDTAAAPVPWNKVPDNEKKVLAPLEKEWKELPGHQHRKLIGAAKEYPKLKPIEQERFQERLRSWSSLSPDQRKTAREQFQSLNSLAPEKQQEIKARWNEKKAATHAPAPADTVTPAPAATINK